MAEKSYFLYIGGFLVIFFVLQKKIETIKKIPKKGFPKKNPERKFEKCCEAKKMHKGHITGRRKNFNKKNQNWRWGIYIEKIA